MVRNARLTTASPPRRRGFAPPRPLRSRVAPHCTRRRPLQARAGARQRAARRLLTSPLQRAVQRLRRGPPETAQQSFAWMPTAGELASGQGAHRLQGSGGTHVTRSSGCAPSTRRAESLTSRSLPAAGVRSRTQNTLSVCARSKSKRGADSDAGVGASSPSMAPRAATASGGRPQGASLRWRGRSVGRRRIASSCARATCTSTARGCISGFEGSHTCMVCRLARSLGALSGNACSIRLSRAAPTPPSCLGAPPGRCCRSPGAGGSLAAPSGLRPKQPRRSTPPPSSACSTA